MNKNHRQNFKMELLSPIFILLAVCVSYSVQIRCFQCSSAEDRDRGGDTCGVYSRFDTDLNIPVDCQGDESHTTGTFCVKITQQGPRGFIWDGRWRQVIRRCASVSDTGVTGVCNWGVYENGVYWEECYCSQDACNSSNRVHIFNSIFKSLIFLGISTLGYFAQMGIY